MGVLQTAEDFADLARAYLRRAHEQNVRYADLLRPAGPHRQSGVPFDVVMAGLRTGLLEAGRQFGLRTQLIMYFLRDLTADYAMATLMDSLRYRDWIVSFGHDSARARQPTREIRQVFRRPDPTATSSPRATVDQDDPPRTSAVPGVFGVDRIDHGVNVLENGGLCAQLDQRRIGLTVLPDLNRYVIGDMKARQIKQLFDRGIRVTINSATRRTPRGTWLTTC